MKKRIFSLILALSLFFGIAGNAFAAANILPSSQTIKGSHAVASWTFSWSGGSGYYKVSFKHDSGISYRTINEGTRYLSQKHSYEYALPINVAAKTHYPSILVVEKEDPGMIVGVAQARVFQSIY